MADHSKPKAQKVNSILYNLVCDEENQLALSEINWKYPPISLLLSAMIIHSTLFS